MHFLNTLKDGVRERYGGTRSLNFKRGSLIKHPRYGLTYIGGTNKGRISLHSLIDGKRLCIHVKSKDIKFKTYNIWKIH